VCTFSIIRIIRAAVQKVLHFWRKRNIFSPLLFLGPLRPGVVTPNKAPPVFGSNSILAEPCIFSLGMRTELRQVGTISPRWQPLQLSNWAHFGISSRVYLLFSTATLRAAYALQRFFLQPSIQLKTSFWFKIFYQQIVEAQLACIREENALYQILVKFTNYFVH